MKDDIDHSRLTQKIGYDPITGIIFRRSSGRIIGYENGDGYLVIVYKNKKYRAHRLIWFHQTGKWPDCQIDHRDGNKSNNQWSNLRQATLAENSRNCAIRKDNTSGFKGVAFHKLTGKWQAYIRVNGRRIHLGNHTTKEQAADAYDTAAKMYHVDFASANHRTS